MWHPLNAMQLHHEFQASNPMTSMDAAFRFLAVYFSAKVSWLHDTFTPAPITENNRGSDCRYSWHQFNRIWTED